MTFCVSVPIWVSSRIYKASKSLTGLVSANYCRIGHGLARSQNSHQQILLRHPLCRKRKGEGDGQRQTFRDGNNYESDRDNQNLDE